MCLCTVYATEQKNVCKLAVIRQCVGWLCVHVCVCVLDCPLFN